LALQPHGLLIIEVAKLGALYTETGREEFFTSDEIALISHDGERPVLGYLNVSEIETHRDYWVDFSMLSDEPAGAAALPEWFGPQTGHDEHLAAYWTSAWRDVLLERVDRLMASGVNGVFLDDVLHYYTHATDENLRWPDSGRPDGPQDAPSLALAMMDLVIVLAERVRAWDCNAFVIVNNGVFIGRDANEAVKNGGAKPVFEAFLAAVDGILVENALSPATHPDTRAAMEEDFLAAGLKVLTIDQLSQYGDGHAADLRRRLAHEARSAGFIPYLIEDAGFNRLWAPIVPRGGA
jgi:uncharacterized protein (TIGR01370 family)